MSPFSKLVARAGILVVFAVARAVAQTSAPPPAAPPLPPNQVPAAAARDPQSGSRVDAPGRADAANPKPTTDPPNADAR